MTTGYLLDSNVVSELAMWAPHREVERFYSSAENLWLSAIVVGELEFGMRRLPGGQRRDELADWLFAVLRRFSDRVLPVGVQEARLSAEFRARAQREGRTLSFADALIAGTAAAADLTLATRNTADFDGLGLRVHNPWDRPRP